MCIHVTLMNKIYICVKASYWIHNSFLSLCIFKLADMKSTITYWKGECIWELDALLLERPSFTIQTSKHLLTYVLCPLSPCVTSPTHIPFLLWFFSEVLCTQFHLQPSQEGVIHGTEALLLYALYCACRTGLAKRKGFTQLCDFLWKEHCHMHALSWLLVLPP